MNAETVKVCGKHEVEFCGERPCDICRLERENEWIRSVIEMPADDEEVEILLHNGRRFIAKRRANWFQMKTHAHVICWHYADDVAYWRKLTPTPRED